MTSISSTSNVKNFSPNGASLPKIILGGVSVLTAILLGCELMRERSTINLPLYNKTIVPIPTKEMNKLARIQEAIEAQCKSTEKAFQGQEERVNTLYQQMNTKDWTLYNSPEFMRPYLGSALGANLENINTYDEALTKNELLKFSLNQCQTRLQTTDEQMAQIRNWADAEGNLITHRQAIQTMNEFINRYDHSIKDDWKNFNYLEKFNYYVPTNYLRGKFSEATSTDSNKVSEFIKQNDILSQFHGEINSIKQEVSSDYHKIFTSIHKKIELAPFSHLIPLSAKEILQAYKLSARLHVAANNAWYRILKYRFSDQIANDKENAANSCFSCSQTEKRDLATEASTARFEANIAKVRVQTQINYVQDLAAELDPQITKIQNHGKACVANPEFKTALEGAVLRIELTDLWQKLSGPSMSLFSTIAKTLNNFNIQDELNSISRKADIVNAQLENVLIDVFMSERLSQAENNKLIAADTSGDEAQKSLRAYLNKWAEPGFIEHI